MTETNTVGTPLSYGTGNQSHDNYQMAVMALD